MCRNIRPLFNFEPPASDDEMDLPWESGELF